MLMPTPPPPSLFFLPGRGCRWNYKFDACECPVACLEPICLDCSQPCMDPKCEAPLEPSFPTDGCEFAMDACGCRTCLLVCDHPCTGPCVPPVCGPAAPGCECVAMGGVMSQVLVLTWWCVFLISRWTYAPDACGCKSCSGQVCAAPSTTMAAVTTTRAPPTVSSSGGSPCPDPCELPACARPPEGCECVLSLWISPFRCSFLFPSCRPGP